MEAIRPGTALTDDPSKVCLDTIIELVWDLHTSTSEEATKGFPPLIERIEFIFSFWGERLRKPEVASVVPTGLVERSLTTAHELAGSPGRRVLLHGDLHPGNVLNGGDRGLVAVDPRACVGDPAFDLIDWVLAEGGDEDTLTGRAVWLAQEAGVAPDILCRWCACAAVLVAIGRLARGEDCSENIRSLVALSTSGV